MCRKNVRLQFAALFFMAGCLVFALLLLVSLLAQLTAEHTHQMNIAGPRTSNQGYKDCDIYQLPNSSLNSLNYSVNNCPDIENEKYDFNNDYDGTNIDTDSNIDPLGVSSDSSSHLFNLNVILCLILWYSTSSLTTQLTKSILTDFDFPVFVGEFQFLFNLLLGYLTIYMARYNGFKSCFPVSTFPKTNKFKFSKFLFKIFFPMGTFQFIGKLFSLAATSLAPVATVSSIRALSPLFIVLGYRIHYKILFSTQTYISLLPLLIGVIIIVISQSDYSSFFKLSIYNEQLKNPKGDDDIEDLETSFFSNLLASLSENQLQLDGIIYALISTSIFAAGSIYAKNIISSSHTSKYNEKERKAIARLALVSTESTANLTTTIDIEKNQCREYQSGSYFNNNNFNHSSTYNHNISNSNNNISNNNSNNINNKLASNKKIDKLTTLMYCSVYGLLYSIPAFISYELPTLLSTQIIPADDSTISVHYYSLIPWSLLILNGLSYFAQSLLAFHILGMLPTVTYSITAMMKRIFVIVISMIVRGKKIGILEFLGLFHITAGLYIYERWGSRQRI